MKNANETHFKAKPTKSGGHLNSDNYLADWYIAVAKKRGWNEVVRLLAQYPEKEQRIKMLIKKRLGK
jgi:hypothetical protein